MYALRSGEVVYTPREGSKEGGHARAGGIGLPLALAFYAPPWKPLGFPVASTASSTLAESSWTPGEPKHPNEGDEGFKEEAGMQYS